MDTDTETKSSNESLLFSTDASYKSPESSDCEGYATPLASSLTDISGITINLPEDPDNASNCKMDSGELTPKIRTASPPIIRQVVFLQKPSILVMTQRELTDEELNVQNRETGESSEEEFYDVADEDDHIRDVAQQLLDGLVEEERVPTPIVSGGDAEEVDGEVEEQRNSGDVEDADVDSGADSENSEESGSATPVAQEAQESQESLENLVLEGANQSRPEIEESVMETVAEVTESIIEKVVAVEPTQMEPEIVMEAQEELEQEAVEEAVQVPEESESVELLGLENVTPVVSVDVIESEELTVAQNKPEVVEKHVQIVEEVVQEVVQVPEETIVCPETEPDVSVVLELAEPVQIEALEEVLKIEEPELKVVTPTTLETTFVVENVEVTHSVEESNAQDAQLEEVLPAPIEQATGDFQLSGDTMDGAEVATVLEQLASEGSDSSLETVETNNQSETVTPGTTENSEVVELCYEVEKQVSIPLPTSLSQELGLETDANTTLLNPETETTAKVEMAMPTLVISDEVKTSQTTTADVDDDLSDCSLHEVKVEFDDADGYSSGKEESLSSSTSSESFEFTETVSPSVSANSEERNQAIRDSINERYPTNGSDDEEELDGAEYDEDLLAVKQISAEVEQLVAAINAFGRDEEQQMSAYLVGKNMAAEKKRKSAMDVVSTCHDQLVQTDNDFVLVDRHLPAAMENLQVEIDKLQKDLEKFKNGEKELRTINAKLQVELDESQQTIDGIEVEAEQQYTELTSEIDELCEIVLKKDQELAGLKEKVANLSVSELNLKDDVDSQRVIVQRQKEIIEGLREELDTITKKLGEVTKLRDKAIEEATIYKMKNMERERFLSREAQMSMEIEDLQRELNKQRLILNGTSMAKIADTFDRKVLHLENELRERDMLICKQNQIINSHRKSPTGSIITTRKMQPRASVLAAAGNLPSAGSSSESFQNGLDVEAKEALLSFILSDRHNQLANIYNIGRILDLTPQEERAVERHLTKDRFT